MSVVDDQTKLNDLQEHEKIARLLELHQKYEQRVRAWDAQNAVPKEMELSDEVEAERASARMDAGRRISILNFHVKLAGLFTLQLVDVILADVLVNGPASCAGAARRYMRLKAGAVDGGLRAILQPTLRTYRDSLAEEAVEERKRVDVLIGKLTD